MLSYNIVFFCFAFEGGEMKKKKNEKKKKKKNEKKKRKKMDTLIFDSMM